MTRYKITIEYEGTGLHGWQRQDGLPTVQQHLENALLSLCKERVEVFGAGRTDAGVHGLAMAAHMDITKPYDAFEIQEALNYYLKDHRVTILTLEVVADDFHARFMARQRHYRYRILSRRARPTVTRGYVWHVIRPLDVEAMQEAAQVLLGHHDFTSFRSVHCESKSAVKTLDALTVRRADGEILVEASARSFLYNQVRIMTGSLVKVGLGEWNRDDLQRVLDAKDRTQAGVTAPAEGLYFLRVDY